MKPNKAMRAAIAAGKKIATKAAAKQRTCIACNGSGRYDTTGSPKCSSCNGTGIESIEDNSSRSANM